MFKVRLDSTDAHQTIATHKCYMEAVQKSERLGLTAFRALTKRNTAKPTTHNGHVINLVICL